jgi:acetyltransferase-like isoleucine patch superfamily enzyme
LFSVNVIPSYVAFAVTLMIVSPLANWLTRARTAPNDEMRIADMSWALMAWARYMVAIHVVRVFAGSLFRGSPLWSAYLRLNGARIGRRVYVNTVHISDHNLLELGDDVVIGSEVHISGHTVEGGVVKTAAVRLGPRVTVGLGTVVEIGVDARDGCQIGALSFVPKFTTLEGNAVYVGAPVRRITPDAAQILDRHR